MIRRALTALILGLGVLVASQPATAQADPTPDEVERAEKLYLDAVTAFKAGEHERAASLFRASYDLVPKPELTYNEAVAWSRANKYRRARGAAVRASRQELPEPMRTKNQARLHAWTMRIGTQKLAERIRQIQDRTSDAVPTEADEPDAVVEEPGYSPGSPGGRIAGISIAATGVAALLGAGIVELQLGNAADRLDAASREEDREVYEAELQRGRRLQTAGKLLLFSGAALVGTGTIVWAFSRPRGTPETTVSFGPGTATATFRF